MKISTKTLTRTAIMLALTLAFQALRFIPVFNNPYIIGTLVNLALIVSVIIVGPFSAGVISIIAPIVALMQGHLPFPVFVPMVALGNIVLCFLFYYVQKINKYAAVAISSLGKWIFLYYASKFVLSFFVSVPLEQFNKLVAGFNIPQLVTALIGGFLAVIISKFLKRSAI